MYLEDKNIIATLKKEKKIIDKSIFPVYRILYAPSHNVTKNETAIIGSNINKKNKIKKTKKNTIKN